MPSLEGTVVEKRIHEIAGQGNTTKAIYKLKSTSTNMSRNAHMYTEAQMDYLKDQFRDQLYYFGYTNHPTEENDTAFWEFPESDPKDLA